MKKKELKIIEENKGEFVPYIKKRLFGWKRLIPNSLPTVYAVMHFLSENVDNNGNPLFSETSLYNIKTEFFNN